jgi:pantoate--beta-alanine ligase
VAQVVSRLFEIVEPDIAVFGRKDYQQVKVVKKITEELKLKVEIIAVETKREADGLAMSSRNALLNNEERKAASIVPKLLQLAKDLYTSKSIAEIKLIIENEVKTNLIYKLDYFEICNAESMQPLRDKNNELGVALIALFCGRIRLIDNIDLVNAS